MWNKTKNTILLVLILAWCTPPFLWDMACVAAVAKKVMPSVTLDTAVYASRDLGRINEVLDDFDDQCRARGINLTGPGYKIELRLIKAAKP